jgi:UPF0716 protein FxsA
VAQITRAGILAPVRPIPSLFSFFFVVSIAEVVLFIAVGSRIGVPATIGLVVLTALAGAFLVARQGRATLWAARADLVDGRFPAKPLAHGVMILVAGALLLTPGFLTDLAGFGLLVPAVREILRGWLVRRFRPDEIITL